MDESKDSLKFYDLGAPVPALATGLSPEDRAGLVSAPKNKRQGLATMRKRIKRLEKIQSQYNELEAKFFKERAALEDKYQKLYEPLYTKRYKIVNGVAKENAAETKNKGLPGFWLNVMKANEVLTRTINKQDEKALKFLKDIKYSRISVPKGFKLEFFFNSNPYFKNSVLTKSFRMADGHAFAPFPMNMMGTEIEWYPGNCLTREILTKRPMKRSKCWTSYWSFFDFFSTIQIPFYDEEMVERIDDEYIIASTIRDRIIPSAVSWFHEEDAQDDDFQDLVGDDCDEEDEDEEEEEEEDEDEEEEEDEDDNERFHTHCMAVLSEDCPPSRVQAVVSFVGEGTSSFGIQIQNKLSEF